MATAETSRRAVRTYGNWRQPTSPGLLGLGTVGTGLMFVALTARAHSSCSKFRF